jgi:quercetin dioxygenase-like cupin family protein
MTDSTPPVHTLASFDPDTFEGWPLEPIIDELLASEPAIREGKSARTLIKAPGLTVVLTVLRAGQQLHEHKAPGSVLVIPLRGAVVFTHAEQRKDVATSGTQVLTMGPGLVHAVTAETDAAFLLVIGPRA